MYCVKLGSMQFCFFYAIMLHQDLVPFIYDEIKRNRYKNGCDKFIYNPYLKACKVNIYICHDPQEFLPGAI